MKYNELVEEYAEAAIESNKILLSDFSEGSKFCIKIAIKDNKLSNVINVSLGEEYSLVPSNV